MKKYTAAQVKSARESFLEAVGNRREDPKRATFCEATLRLYLSNTKIRETTRKEIEAELEKYGWLG